MRISKQKARGSQPVEVRSPGLRMAPETPHPIIEIIDGNEENVGAFRP